MKLATLNQLTSLSPSSFRGPVLTPSAYLTTSLPVDVGMISGVSANRPINSIFARGLGAVVEKARKEEAARGTIRRDCILSKRM